ncbi:MAG: DUF5372 family protein [Bacillota bacterium]
MTPYPNCREGFFQVTHPYHPLCGQEFELVTYRQNWGEDRVFFHDREGRLRSIPASWTSVGAIDPFVAVSAGRSFFRVEDLLALIALLQGIKMNNQRL